MISVGSKPVGKLLSKKQNKKAKICFCENTLAPVASKKWGMKLQILKLFKTSISPKVRKHVALATFASLLAKYDDKVLETAYIVPVWCDFDAMKKITWLERKYNSRVNALHYKIITVVASTMFSLSLCYSTDFSAPNQTKLDRV